MRGDVRYRGGGNVAMRLPPHHFDDAVEFYGDTLGLGVSDHGDSKLVEVGAMRLWLDAARNSPRPSCGCGSPANIVHIVSEDKR